jgi:dTDP-4-dehydrorhamnose reductase
MQKLLVTGASGFLGWNLCQVAAYQWQVYGTYCSHAIEIPGATLLNTDLQDFQQLKALFQQVQPDAIVHLAAQSSPNLCESQPEESYRMNVTVACNVAGLCADYQIPLAFTSTDLVFDGLHPPYRETDPTSPVNRYGEQKAEAEAGVLSRYPGAAVCRMPLMFGAAPPTASSFLQPFLQVLRSGQELKLFTDEFRTPVSGKTAAQGLLLALQRVQGRIHLGGRERLSRYAFGQLLLEVFDLSDARLAACCQQDITMAANRPPDVSLDSSRAFSFGYAPLSLRQELEALKGMV